MIRRDADLYIQSVRLKHFHFLKYVKILRKTRKVFQFGSRQFFTIFITNFGFLLVLVKKNKKKTGFTSQPVWKSTLTPRHPIYHQISTAFVFVEGRCLNWKNLFADTADKLPHKIQNQNEQDHAMLDCFGEQYFGTPNGK